MGGNDNTIKYRKKSNYVKPWSQAWLIAAGAYPGFCSMKRLEVFLLSLDRTLVHTHLYSRVEKGTVRVKYPFQLRLCVFLLYTFDGHNGLTEVKLH